jgi:hypothetical protein
MVAGEWLPKAFTRAISLSIVVSCDIPLDRKPAGLPERRFRLSHHHSTNA